MRKSSIRDNGRFHFFAYDRDKSINIYPRNYVTAKNGFVMVCAIMGANGYDVTIHYTNENKRREWAANDYKGNGNFSRVVKVENARTLVDAFDVARDNVKMW